MAESLYFQVSLLGDVKFEQFVDIPDDVDPEDFAQNLAQDALDALQQATPVDTGNLRDSWTVEDADSGHILIEDDAPYALWVNDGNEPREGATRATIPVGFHYVEDAMSNFDNLVQGALDESDTISPDATSSTDITPFKLSSNTYTDTGQTLKDVLAKAGQTLQDSLDESGADNADAITALLKRLAGLKK